MTSLPKRTLYAVGANGTRRSIAMSDTPEGKVKKRIKEILNAHAPDVWYTMPIGTGYGRSGVPDFIGVSNGQFFAIEAKSGKNQPTALQLLTIDKIHEAGGWALVVNEDNIEDVKSLLQRE